MRNDQNDLSGMKKVNNQKQKPFLTYLAVYAHSMHCLCNIGKTASNTHFLYGRHTDFL